MPPLNQGPEEGGIPSQFPLGEDVQFIQILREAQDFFGIDEEQAKEYFLVDHRTSKFYFWMFFLYIQGVRVRWEIAHPIHPAPRSLREAQESFGIDEARAKEYFLADSTTEQISSS